MPNDTYDNAANANMSTLQIVHGNVKPGSDLEEASIASGIPPASLDIYYPDDSEEKHAHEHSGHATAGR